MSQKLTPYSSTYYACKTRNLVPLKRRDSKNETTSSDDIEGLKKEKSISLHSGIASDWIQRPTLLTAILVTITRKPYKRVSPITIIVHYIIPNSMIMHCGISQMPSHQRFIMTLMSLLICSNMLMTTKILLL